MKEAENQLLGRVSNQLQLDYVNEHADIFANQELGITLTKRGTSLPGGQHVHSSYEFLIMMDQPLSALVDKTIYVIETGSVFPFNTEQYHGPKCCVNDFNSICITVEKDYLSGVSKAVFSNSEMYFKNKNYKITNELKSLLHMFTFECKHKQTGYEFILQSLAGSIAVNLIRHTENNFSIYQEDKFYSDKPFIKRVIDYLHENYRNGYSMDDIAKIANYSPYHLTRTFKSETGKTPYDYLMDIKVEKAKLQLADRKKTIMEVSCACGFNNPNHFTCIFKQRTGITPSTYRKTCCI